MAQVRCNRNLSKLADIKTNRFNNTSIYGTSKLFEAVTLINGASFTGSDTDNNKATYIKPNEPSNNNLLKLPDGSGGLLAFSNSSHGVIADGAQNQVLRTNGAGTLTFADALAQGVVSGTASVHQQIHQQELCFTIPQRIS